MNFYLRYQDLTVLRNVLVHKSEGLKFKCSDAYISIGVCVNRKSEHLSSYSYITDVHIPLQLF